MHTYRKSKNEQLWTVGFWERLEGSIGGERWNALHHCRNERDAMRLVNYLNGGDGWDAPLNDEADVP